MVASWGHVPTWPHSCLCPAGLPGLCVVWRVPGGPLVGRSVPHPRWADPDHQGAPHNQEALPHKSSGTSGLSRPTGKTLIAAQAQVGMWGLLLRVIWVRSLPPTAKGRCFPGKQACNRAALRVDNCNFSKGKHNHSSVLLKAFCVHLHGTFDLHAPRPSQ